MLATSEEPKKRKGRGPGKRPALVCTSIRLDREVMDYFHKHHSTDKQRQMRVVLAEYVKNQQLNEGVQDGTQENVDE